MPSTTDAVDQLSGADLRRVLRVLEAAERAPALLEFRLAVLEGLAREFGWASSNFLLAEPLRAGVWPRDGLGLDLPESSMEDYVVEEGRRDVVFAPTAVARIRREQVACLTDALRDARARGYPPDDDRYLRAFLTRHRIGDLLSVWLDTGVHQHAFVTLIARDAAQFADAARERAVLRALRPHLATLLRHHLLAAGRLDPAGLTAQERRLCALVATGLSNREIAVTLSLAEDTVKKYVSRVLTKLDLRSRTQLAARWRG